MTFQPKYLHQIVIAVLLVVLGGVAGYRVAEMRLNTGSPAKGPVASLKDVLNREPNSSLRAKTAEADFEAFWQVWQLLEKEYLRTERLDANKMVHGAIAGLAASLEDPYTMYLPPADNQRSAEDLAGAFFGVGIELDLIEGTVGVLAPLSGSPAEKAGLKPGDLILRVKDPAKNLDQETTGWSLAEAVDNIRGPKGSAVVLTIFRKGETAEAGATAAPFEVTVIRDEIIVESVKLSFTEHAGKKVAHLKLSRFGERTEQEWNAAVEKILAEKAGLAGVVLDMRNNPGGFFEGAIDISSEFIESGVVVSQKGRTDSQDYAARGVARLASMPVVVVVNQGSASAAEIVAGALRDQRSAKLVGEKTYGKGTVQDRLELNNGGGVHITIAEWLLPKGDSIQETGIPVTVEVKDVPETEADEVLQKAIEEL